LEAVGKRSGFLHYAAHDETVSSFGRNDGFLEGENRERERERERERTSGG
jgi:hypothetical protein